MYGIIFLGWLTLSAYEQFISVCKQQQLQLQIVGLWNLDTLHPCAIPIDMLTFQVVTVAVAVVTVAFFPCEKMAKISFHHADTFLNIFFDDSTHLGDNLHIQVITSLLQYFLTQHNCLLCTAIIPTYLLSTPLHI